jgi:hypothetical protein
MKLVSTTALTAALMTAAVLSLTSPVLAQTGYNPPGPFTPAFGGTGSTYAPSYSYGYGTGSSYTNGYIPPGPFTPAFGGTNGYGGYGPVYGNGTGYVYHPVTRRRIYATGAGYHPVTGRRLYATAAGVHHHHRYSH